MTLKKSPLCMRTYPYSCAKRVLHRYAALSLTFTSTRISVPSLLSSSSNQGVFQAPSRHSCNQCLFVGSERMHTVSSTRRRGLHFNKLAMCAETNGRIAPRSALDSLSLPLQFALLGSGVFFFFGIHNILQEAIMKVPGFHFGVMLGYMEVIG